MKASLLSQLSFGIIYGGIAEFLETEAIFYPCFLCLHTFCSFVI